MACSGCILFCPNNSDHQTKHRFNIFQPYYPTKSYKFGNLGFHFPQNLSNINIESKHIQTHISSFVEEEWCNQVITIHSFFSFLWRVLAASFSAQTIVTTKQSIDSIYSNHTTQQNPTSLGTLDFIFPKIYQILNPNISKPSF